MGDGECVVVDLGILQPGDVYDMSLIVVDDAVDLLLFDQNGLQPYELGQSYRSSVVFPPAPNQLSGATSSIGAFPPPSLPSVGPSSSTTSPMTVMEGWATKEGRLPR